VTEIIKTEGVVLKRRDFGETSRVAVAYTRDAGKVQLLAKGARNPKNKYGAALEPLSRGEFVFYWRESKELFTLSETATIRPGRFIREDAKALPYGLAMVEAVDKLSGEGDADPRLYELLASTLEALDRGGPPAPLLAQFLLKLAAQLGLNGSGPQGRHDRMPRVRTGRRRGRRHIARNLQFRQRPHDVRAAPATARKGRARARRTNALIYPRPPLLPYRFGNKELDFGVLFVTPDIAGVI
jgi:DNA repair protein RecO (recombination protein O)